MRHVRLSPDPDPGTISYRILLALRRRGKEHCVPAQCDLCGKQTAFGRNIRHKASGRWQRKAHRTSRQFRPNLQRHAVWRAGKRVTLSVCTRCLRTALKTS